MDDKELIKLYFERNAYTPIIRNADFSSFTENNGKIYSMTQDGAEIICSDPEWTDLNANQTYTTTEPASASNIWILPHLVIFAARAIRSISSRSPMKV